MTLCSTKEALHSGNIMTFTEVQPALEEIRSINFVSRSIKVEN